MAVFSVRENWRGELASSEAEEFDSRALCVGSFVSEQNSTSSPGSVKIQSTYVATGSLSGVLRIYEPQLEAYSIEDLLLETILDAPILQIECGRFVSLGSEELTLAILHPRELVVFRLVRKSKELLLLEKQYAHQLGDGGEHFSAANFVFGPFGGIRGKDFIAVQSLDGQIHVLEQERFAFVRQLNDVLLPGPMQYVRKLDAFLVCNSQFQVDCYKYQILATSSSRVSSSKAANLQTDWTFTAGEQVLDIQYGRVSAGLGEAQIDIVVLCDRSIYCLSERGVVRMHIKLEIGCNPMCFSLIPLLPSRESTTTMNHNILLCSEAGQITILRELGIVWSAGMTSHIPVAMSVAPVGGVQGMIVSMSDDGHVVTSHLGTETSKSVLAPRRTKRRAQTTTKNTTDEEQKLRGEAKSNNFESTVEELQNTDEMEYEEMDQEHQRLLQRIRSLHKELEDKENGVVNGQAAPKTDIVILVDVPPSLDELNHSDAALAISEDRGRDYGYRNDGQIMQVTLKLHVTNRLSKDISNIQISLDMDSAFVPADSSIHLTKLQGSQSPVGRSPSILYIPVRVKAKVLPATLHAKAVCSYKLHDGRFRSVTTSFRLPLFMAVKARPAIKNSLSKITLDTNVEAARIPIIFDELLRQPGMDPDMVASVSGASANVFSMDFLDGENATILASKSGDRYRIQGSSLGHLSIVTEELQLRLHNKFGEALEISVSENLPLNGLFAAVDDHHSARVKLANLTADLNDRAHQYRLVQKRLLSRFKDKNAPPLRGLDTLLRVTHEQIMQLVAEIETGKSRRHRAAQSLSATLRLIIDLAATKYDLSLEDVEILQSHVPVDVQSCDDETMGWEEVTDLSITHLLRTTLAKVPKEVVPASAQPSGSNLGNNGLAVDASKVRKRLGMLFDRISKGARPAFTLGSPTGAQDSPEFKDNAEDV